MTSHLLMTVGLHSQSAAYMGHRCPALCFSPGGAGGGGKGRVQEYRTFELNRFCLGEVYSGIMVIRLPYLEKAPYN